MIAGNLLKWHQRMTLLVYAFAGALGFLNSGYAQDDRLADLKQVYSELMHAKSILEKSLLEKKSTATDLYQEFSSSQTEQSQIDILQWYTDFKNYNAKIDLAYLAKQMHLAHWVNARVEEVVQMYEWEGNFIDKSLLTRYYQNYKTWGEYNIALANFGPKEQINRLYKFYFLLKDAQEIFRRYHPNFKEMELELKPVKSVTALIKSALWAGAYPLTRTVSNHAIFPVLNRSITNFVKAKDIQIFIKGQLPPEDSNVITLYLPSHKDAATDMLMLFSLGIQDAMVFANAYEIGKIITGSSTGALTRRMQDYIANARDLAAVGKVKSKLNGKPVSSTKKLFYALETGGYHNIVNYPQGFTAFTNEILDINHDFSKKLLLPLVQKGYRLRIVPITFDISDSFMNFGRAYSYEPLYVTIHDPLHHEAILKILELELKKGYPGLFSMLLRNLWIETTVRYPELSLQDSISVLKDNFYGNEAA